MAHNSHIFEENSTKEERRMKISNWQEIFFENLDTFPHKECRGNVTNTSSDEPLALYSFEQKANEQLLKFMNAALSEKEENKVPLGYYTSSSGVLMRK